MEHQNKEPWTEIDRAKFEKLKKRFAELKPEVLKLQQSEDPAKQHLGSVCAYLCLLLKMILKDLEEDD